MKRENAFIVLIWLGILVVRAEKQPAAYVNPLIGSAGHGHVFVGASRPFGMVQLGPTNISTGWDWCSGYNYVDSTIIGFTHNHLSGTGIGDLGDILFMPASADVPLSPGTSTNLGSGYVSSYSHQNETVRPGYYAVWLDKYKIKAELTATERVGMHRYTYPANKMQRLVLDLEQGIGPGFGGRIDRTEASLLHQLDSFTLEGYRFSSGWAKGEKIYFAVRFSRPFRFARLQCNGESVSGIKAEGQVVKALLDFGQDSSNQLVAKVSLSYVSCQNAFQNMDAELPAWDFDKIAADAYTAWNKALSSIKASFSDEAKQTVFYTALFHTMIAPSLFSDVNGGYRGADGEIYKSSTGDIYTTFSLWDTYRAVHPLFTLTSPDRVSGFINSFLNIYKQQGRLPVWHLVGNETDCMVGYHAIPVIVDAYFKGIKGFDPEEAFEAMKAYADVNLRGLPFIKEYGYIPADSILESVSSGLEFCIDDWCIARMAKALGKEGDYQAFNKRASGYRNYFDPMTLFMRARLSDGTFRKGFDPYHYEHTTDDYVEGNAWQYTWLVPHDVEGLMTLFGTTEQFVQRLDTLFVVPSDITGGGALDLSGMIGQYVHGNEPSHHIAYLYAYAGQQWKTASIVHQIMNRFYTDKPDGLCGNEDCGQMSAWYVFSALGFYPVNPANGIYVFGTPLVDKAEIDVEGGKKFTIRAKSKSDKNIYIQSVTLNGKSYNKSYISHRDIRKGGELVFEMGAKPNKEFAKDIAGHPFSQYREQDGQ